jgi:thiol:disulfide interchange protein
MDNKILLLGIVVVGWMLYQSPSPGRIESEQVVESASSEVEELPIIRTLPVSMTSPAIEEPKADEPKKVEVIEPSSKYEVARDKAEKEDKPLVVYVGAEWCEPCKKMKREVLQPMLQAGELKDVVFVELDFDKDEFANQVMVGSAVPQLVAFKRVKGWRPFPRIGFQSRESVREFTRTVIR